MLDITRKLSGGKVLDLSQRTVQTILSIKQRVNSELEKKGSSDCHNKI